MSTGNPSAKISASELSAKLDYLRFVAEKASPIVEKFRDIVQFAHEGLLQGSPKAESAWKAINAGDATGAPMAREALIELLGQLANAGSIPAILNNLVEDFCARLVREREEPASAPQVCHRQVVDHLDGIKQNLDKLTRNAQPFVDSIIPHGAFSHNYKNDRPREKELVAKYVLEKYFKERRQCFVQASTWTIHLGRCIVEATSVAGDCVFHTNSAVFPLTVLREDGDHYVYTTCGSLYDDVCGGWLFKKSDSETIRQFRELFTRPHEPLTIALLTPMAVTVDEGMFYRKEQAAYLVDTLLEVRPEPEVVIVLTSDRLHERRADLNPNQNWFATHPWSELGAAPAVIVGPDNASRPVPGQVQRLRKKGLRVDWYDHASDKWRVNGVDEDLEQ